MVIDGIPGFLGDAKVLSVDVAEGIGVTVIDAVPLRAGRASDFIPLAIKSWDRAFAASGAVRTCSPAFKL